MNDFHTLTICLERKDTNAVMLTFRNKSEFSAKKNTRKIKDKDNSRNGKTFLAMVTVLDTDQLPLTFSD